MSTTTSDDLSDLNPELFKEPPDLNPINDDPEALQDNHPLFLRRPHRGRTITVKSVWEQSRTRLPHEPERNKHGHRIWYCKRCQFKGTVTNGRRHLKQHSIDVSNESLLERATTNNTAITAAIGRQNLLAHAQAEEKVRNTLRNAVDKKRYRDAVARLVTRLKLKHTIVEYNEFKALCLCLN